MSDLSVKPLLGEDEEPTLERTFFKSTADIVPATVYADKCDSLLTR